MSSSHRAAKGFALTKWYLDVVSADGRVAIAYWAALQAGAVSLQWHCLSQFAPGESPREQTSLHHAAEPQCVAHHLQADNPHLEWNAVYGQRGGAPPIALLDSPDGGITWQCHAAADARFRAGAEVLDGTGYVERLQLTLPPWRIPIDELRWGRWISDDLSRSTVWIDWRGPEPRRWVIENGTVTSSSVLTDHDIRTTHTALTLDAPRVLHERAVGTVVRSIAGLARLVGTQPLQWSERKMLSRARWTGDAASSTDGWAIHEVVLMR